MSNKTTKRALLSSVVALFLCCAMLMGTTYAWFTDSVTSANNVIKSGNLDVEFEYWNGTEWVDVAGKSDILTNTLWEPGVTEVAYLRIANAGSLALKYQLGINILSETKGKNVAGDDLVLSDYIQFGVVENVNGETGDYDDRAAAVAAVADAKKISAGYTKASSMESGDELYLALVVWMPESVGNEANHNGEDIPQINLGLNIVATQVANENDSFGSDYDEDAWHTEMKVYTAADLNAALANAEPGTEIVLQGDIELDAPIVIPAAPTTYSRRSVNAVKLDLNGKTITTAYNETTKKHQYAIDNYGNLVIEGGVIEARGIYNREGANLTVNGTKIVNLDSNGGSSIWSYGGSVVLNDAELIGYTGCVYSDGYLEINGGTYTCYSSILDDGTQLTPTYNIRSNGELVINGGDFTSRHGLIGVGGTSAVINGGTYTMTSIGVITSHVFYVYGDSSVVTVNGGTFNCDLRTAQANGSSMICVDATDVTVALCGGAYNLAPADGYVANGYKAVENGGKFYVVPEEAGTVIVTAADLLALGGKSLEGVVYIAADIDLNGAAMPTIGAAYGKSLTVIGAGHTISNGTTAHTTHNGMKHHGFFYAYTNSILTVSDLSFDGIVIDATKDAERNFGAAIVVAYADGGSNVVLNNVDVANCKVLNNSDEAGAYVGYQTGTLTMTDCDSVKCEIVGETAEKTGAFIGMVNGTATLTDCTTDLEIGYCNRIGGTLVIDGMTVVATADDLKAALAAGKNVILVNDITMNVTGTAFTVGSGVSVKIDLNGHNIIATSTSTESVELFYVSGTLEIDGNGAVALTGKNFGWDTRYRYTTINIRETGEVTLGEDVTVLCTARASNDAADYGMNYAVDIYHTGVLNINGADLYSNYIVVRCFYDGGVVNVGAGSEIYGTHDNGYGIWLQSSPNAKVTIDSSVRYTFDGSTLYYF